MGAIDPSRSYARRSRPSASPRLRSLRQRPATGAIGQKRTLALIRRNRSFDKSIDPDPIVRPSQAMPYCSACVFNTAELCRHRMGAAVRRSCSISSTRRTISPSPCVSRVVALTPLVVSCSMRTQPLEWHELDAGLAVRRQQEYWWRRGQVQPDGTALSRQSPTSPAWASTARAGVGWHASFSAQVR